MLRIRALIIAAALLVPASAHAFQVARIEILQQSVKTSGQSFVTGFGLRTQLKGGDLNDGFAFCPAIENWSKVSRLPELGVPEIRQRDWRLGGDLRYRFGDSRGWAPYAGAGLALDIVHSYARVHPESSPEFVRENSGRKLAPNFLVGVDTPATGPIRSSFELSWHLVPDLKQFKINFGIGYDFGAKAAASSE
jgi:hypothetical protein